MIRRHVVVHGQVQGVFFRAGCHREAELARVRGWVRNRPDGAVEAVFEGTEAAVEAICAWCRQGPPRALVDRLDVAEETPEGIETFEIR